MDGRQRLGAAMLVSGVVLAVIGVVGLVTDLGSEAVATASPTPAAGLLQTPIGPTTAPPTEPAMSAARPTVAPTAAATEDLQALVRAFFEELETAIRAGTPEELLDRLGPAVIERYGLPACSTNLSSRVAVPEQAFEILAIHPPAPWGYVTDELTTNVPDAITVEARVTGPDAAGVITTAERELHVQMIDGVVHWFTDCGEPIA